MDEMAPRGPVVSGMAADVVLVRHAVLQQRLVQRDAALSLQAVTDGWFAPRARSVDKACFDADHPAFVQAAVRAAAQ